MFIFFWTLKPALLTGTSPLVFSREVMADSVVASCVRVIGVLGWGTDAKVVQ